MSWRGGGECHSLLRVGLKGSAVAETAGKAGRVRFSPQACRKMVRWEATSESGISLSAFQTLICLNLKSHLFVCVYSGYHSMGVPVRGQLYRSWFFASAR